VGPVRITNETNLSSPDGPKFCFYIPNKSRTCAKISEALGASNFFPLILDFMMQPNDENEDDWIAAFVVVTIGI